jgi:hypothetical protein
MNTLSKYLIVGYIGKAKDFKLENMIVKGKIKAPTK